MLSLLDSVTAQQAAAHPIPGAHSIWQLALHIAAWERAFKRRLEGDPAQLTDLEDWQPINDTSEAAWENTKQQLIDNHRELLEAIAKVDDARLNDPIVKDSQSSVYVTLHGGVQHALYHAGQIAMLKKALVNL